ncbi:putative disease resistance protein RGA3 [Salvia hispanica]|uniref:putative disease resistance protein RGA3 n=1 Tax=Salvia hispanica TaxID=49212 RepID=UPI002009CDE6|nr:putative disease resistance protein RGA3 [Salvia hispanica]
MEVETAAAAAFINVAIENVINFSRKMSLGKLSKSLETVQMMLNNEEMTPSVTSEVFTQWLKKLGPVVLDADNVVDELKYHLLSKEINIFKPHTIKAKVLTYLPSPILDTTEIIMAPKINEINEKLEPIIKEGKDAGLIGGAVNAPSQFIATGGETTVSSFPAPVFVGRDDDVLKLADKLITNATKQEKHVLSILAILGMSGMGITTLATKIFSCESIITRFGESRIWVHVGQAFDPIILYTKILATFTSDPAESRDDILKRLQQSLIGKTFLLVLDDVWYHDVVILEDFLKSLNGVITTKGNATIITTRDQKVAETVKPFHIHQPKALLEEECWSIIKNITFGDQGVQPDFEEKGKDIARRCGSLPLATYLVGGILRGKTQQQWELIANTLQSQDEQKLTSEILRLSFQNLSPPSLKMCFTYCSIFPKGHKIVKQELIELWMAQGFLESNDKDDMEFVGGTFSNVLVHNSMLQVAETDENGNVESFVMHDLLHDLASSVSGSQYSGDGLVPVHYLTLEEKSSPVTKEMAKHVRALFVEGGEISDNMLSDYPSLRTLSLTRVKELPDSISKLIHLRNLNISKSWITQLPEWIGELHNLQTLRADTKHLWKLPSTLKYLINLRHLYVLSRVKLPAEMGRLTNLRTLRHFAVGENKGYQIEEL